MSRVLDGKNQITQEYKKGKHNGIDLVKYKSQTCGILAHSEGIVTSIVTGKKNDKNATGTASYGNYVKIKHNNGYYTLYAHLDKVYVKKGAKVKKGQPIGYMGNSGHSFGAHLHFEQRNTLDERINPTDIINADMTGGYQKGVYTLTEKKYVRTGPGVSYSIKKVKDLTPNGQKNATSKKPNALAEYKVGTRFDAQEIVLANNLGLWAKTPSGYVCIVSAKGTKYIK